MRKTPYETLISKIHEMKDDVTRTCPASFALRQLGSPSQIQRIPVSQSPSPRRRRRSGHSGLQPKLVSPSGPAVGHRA